MKTSGLYTLDVQDAVKGLIVAAGGAMVAAVSNTIDSGSLNLNWRQIGLTGLAAGISYLSKNFFTEAKIVKHAVK